MQSTTTADPADPAPYNTTYFQTPKGRWIPMFVRDGTADHNNVYSCLTEDEYGFRDVDLNDQAAIDIGAHIGGVSIGWLVDNPRAIVVAVEALSVNVELLRLNAERNGVDDRLRIMPNIAGSPVAHGRMGSVAWDFDGPGESAKHHRFIGNAQFIPIDTSRSEKRRIVSLAAMLELAGGTARMVKMDCEGCEYDVLASDAATLGAVQEFRGEFHGGYDRVYDYLNVTHHVMSGDPDSNGIGHFTATRR